MFVGRGIVRWIGTFTLWGMFFHASAHPPVFPIDDPLAVIDVKVPKVSFTTLPADADATHVNMHANSEAPKPPIPHGEDEVAIYQHMNQHIAALKKMAKSSNVDLKGKYKVLFAREQTTTTSSIDHSGATYDDNKSAYEKYHGQRIAINDIVDPFISTPEQSMDLSAYGKNYVVISVQKRFTGNGFYTNTSTVYYLQKN